MSTVGFQSFLQKAQRLGKVEYVTDLYQVVVNQAGQLNALILRVMREESDVRQCYLSLVHVYADPVDSVEQRYQTDTLESISFRLPTVCDRPTALRISVGQLQQLLRNFNRRLQNNLNTLPADVNDQMLNELPLLGVVFQQLYSKLLDVLAENQDFFLDLLKSTPSDPVQVVRLSTMLGIARMAIRQQAVSGLGNQLHFRTLQIEHLRNKDETSSD